MAFNKMNYKTLNSNAKKDKFKNITFYSVQILRTTLRNYKC